MIATSEVLKDIIPYETELFDNGSFLKLDSNENQFGASPKVIKALKNISKENISFYPHYGNLIKLLAEKFNLDLDNFLITAGCDEAICTIYRTYINQGDNVLSYSPTFSVPKIITESIGGNFVEVSYSEKWNFDIEKFITKAREIEPKIIHITSPNSPTGECVPNEYIKIILENFQDSVVILDNTYSNYADITFSESEILKYNNLFITKSFSKDYALAGLRLGYIISNRENIKNVTKAILPYSVNNFALIAGIEALKDKKYFEKVRKNTEKNKRELKSILENLGFMVYPSNGNFILCDMGKYANFIYKKLLINKIKIRKFNNPDLENTFRITIPNNKGLKNLKQALKTKDLLVFDMDGVLFDVRNSYREAIKVTYKEFKGEDISDIEIQRAKNLGGLNCDWKLTQYLLKKSGLDIELETITDVFQKYFFNKKENGSMGLIDNEKIIIKKDLLEKLSKHYDLCIFTGRTEEEAFYSLKKFGIFDYFNIIITQSSINKDEQKPNPRGLEIIKNYAKYNKILYFGDTIDDMTCAKYANVDGIAVLPPQDKTKELKLNMCSKGAKAVLKNINDIRKVL